MILEIILNRLRGTGDIFTFGKIKITGVMLYALYLFILITVLSSSYPYFYLYGLLGALLFMVGESFAWGKWVSYLCYPEGHPLEYDNKAGQGFPFIHQTVNFFIDQTKNYKRYCELALTLRGIYWWLPLMILFYILSFIGIYEAIILTIFLGLSFPLACYLGRTFTFTFKICKNNWERQEVFYGVFQGIALWYIIIRGLYG